MTGRSQKVEFPGSQGHLLAARLELPDGLPVAYAVFAHCFTCSKDVFAASRISRALAEQGIAVLRFDFTGLGNSAGDFASTNFSSNVDDLIQAADFLREQYQPPRLLVGHSLGGAAVLMAAARVPETTAVATIGAPSDPAHVSHLFEGARQEIENQGEVEVNIAGRRFPIRRQFLEDLEGQQLTTRVRELRRALLVFHAPRDEIVGIDHARRIFEAAKHPKSFISLHDADHLLSHRRDSRYVASVLAAWAARYLEPVATDGTDPTPLPHGVVRVSETGRGRYEQLVESGAHRLAADEPVEVGGDDAGPSPYDYLLAALGSCTSMTLRMYADRKQWPLERVSVELAHDRIHAEDCENCDTKQGKIDRIRRSLRLRGALDAEQRARLLEIADRCPVHRTLTGEIRVETEEVAPPTQ